MTPEQPLCASMDALRLHHQAWLLRVTFAAPAPAAADESPATPPAPPAPVDDAPARRRRGRKRAR